MSLFDSIAAMFKTKQTPPTTADAPTQTHLSASSSGANIAELFTAERTRAGIISAARTMYAEDTRAKGVINTVARDAVKGGFVVKTQDTRAQKSADALTKRLKLGMRLDDWARMSFRDGDSFLEIGVTADREIALVTRKPTTSMRRHSNAADQFDDPTHAFWQARNTWDVEPTADAVWFAEWQIVHARWNHDEGSRYGEPLFASASKAYKRMGEGEFDIAVRRKTRAGKTRLHIVEGATPDELEEYKNRNKDILADAFAAVADFFSNKAGTLQEFQGDANLAQIEDVMHHIRTFFLASPIPMSLLGYGQDLNRDVLDKQEEQYCRALEQITQWVEDEIVVPLLERQWLLDGILPEGLQYQIEWQSKAPLSSTDALNIANAALTLKTLGVGDELIVTLLQRFLPGVDVRTALLGGTLTPPNETNTEQLANAANQ